METTGGMAIAGMAGARRAASSPSRFDEAAHGRDVFVSGADADPAPLDAILDGPLVESHLDLVFVFAQPNLEEQVVTFAPTADHGLDIEQGVLLDGRRADPDNPDDVVVSEVLAARYDLAPGDVFELVSLSPEQARKILEEAVAPTSADGPVLHLDVVGVSRTTADIAARQDEPASLLLSPAFVDRYGDRVGIGTASHMVRLVDEPDVLDRFTDAVAAAYPGEQLGFDVVQAEDIQSDSVTVITIALAILGLLVAVAGLLWIAATCIRQQRLATTDVAVLRALGSTPRERAVLLGGSVAPGIVAGAVLAPLVAIGLSPVFPIGLARRYEPDPGVHLDVTVLAVGVLTLLLVVGAVVAFSSWRLVGEATSQPAQRSRPPWVDGVTRTLRPAPATGLRFALSSPGTASAPVRPAIAGACLAVVALTAVAVIGASLERVVDTPARWGTNFDVAIRNADNTDIVPDPALPDAAVASSAIGLFDEQVTIAGRETLAVTLEPGTGGVELTVVDGRAPRGDDEVAVGGDTLARLDASLGDTVEIESRSSGPIPFTIVGVVLFPTIDLSFPLADGAAFTGAGGNRLGLGDRARDDHGFRALLVRWRLGTVEAAMLDGLANEGLQVLQPTPPPEVNGLADVKWFPVVAAVALAILGAIATSQAIAVTARRRRGDLAVLSVLGFTPGQRRIAVAAQVTVIALVALLIGIPLGIALGRVVWGALAGSMSLATDIAVPVVTVLTGGIGFVVVLNLVGAVPGRFARRLRVADALRVE